MNDSKQKEFDDLCKVVVYHQADCCVKAGGATRRLIKSKVMEDAQDWEAAYKKYEEAVLEYAKDQLPEDWDITHDYWGAKCLFPNPGWNAPKSGTLFAGDKSGFIMFFENFQALKEYTERCLNDIEVPA